MVEDLLAYHVKRGVTWDEVHALLGEPHITTWSDHYGVYREWGLGRGPSRECATLEVRFLNQRVVGTSRSRLSD